MTLDSPDPDQGHSREWPSTPYSDEARLKDPPLEEACSIALIGDCTVACTYYPPANRPENHLLLRLHRVFPQQPCRIFNLARDGECAADFLAPERMAASLSPFPRLDVAFLRYGINDRKRYGVSACIEHLESLCCELRERYPAITLMIETGIWVDYPAHYLWDRNSRLAPLYDAVREFAYSRGFPLVDIFKVMAGETRRGNWDLRVRGLPTPDHLVVDDSFDDLFGQDPAYFTNIHPNSHCLSLIARLQVEKMQTAFGKRLPCS